MTLSDIEGKFVCTVLRGTDMLASMPSLLASGMMRGFASARLPLPVRAAAVAKLPMFMVWHQRYQKDPAHLWLREELRHAAGVARSSQV